MGAFKLGKMTFGSLFKKPETVLYPIQSKPQPKGLKGHIVIDVDRCIVCGMCDRNCSTDCISVDRKARTWSINPFACVQCGYCVTVCPKDCLKMDPNYFPAATEKSSTTFEIPEQPKPEKAGKGSKEPREVPKADMAQQKQQVSQAVEQPAVPQGNTMQDEQLERLLALMDSEKADRVKAVLAR